ncbi:MAG: hypothetical protein QOC58_1641 [Mycobacterium sp.]|jgi:N-acetylglucosaminyldiphosphoundecaprenol N-acetyl-beta-D-mannosaminyltransferase|nr:hypothetical protein [Mycobacterium sp.]
MGPARIRLGDLWFDALPQREVVDAVRKAWAAGKGGHMIPVNVDVGRAATRDPALH